MEDPLPTILIAIGVVLLLITAYISIDEFYSVKVEAKNFSEAATAAMKYLIKAIPLIIAVVVGSVLLDYGVKARFRIDVQD